jgi:hypothetical protein
MTCWCRGAGGKVVGGVGEVVLLKRDDASRPHAAYQPAEHGDGIREVHQEPAANNRIEIVIQDDTGHIAIQKGDVRPPYGADPLPRRLEDSWIHLDPYHIAPRANQVSQQQGHVPGATPDVQHFHAGADTGGYQKLPGDGAVDLGLPDQPPGLRRGTTQSVGIGWIYRTHGCSSSQ